MFEDYRELVHLARLALAGRRQDIEMFIRRLGRRVRPLRPDVANELEALIAASPTRESPLRSDTVSAVPVDADSRLQLIRPQYPVVLDVDPIWREDIRSALELVLLERQRERDLMKAGLSPARSMLFTGPPGVGKSLAAKWLASKLNLPLLTLDLSAVMSSFLGKTGTNVRYVLDYAKGMRCVLFLDELDAVAKRRDDAAEIGELKRLVTVLLQEIDDWPATSLLLAATNHSELLDPALWRRFDAIVEFPMPTDEQVAEVVSQFLSAKDASKEDILASSLGLRNLSFSDIDRELKRAHREAVLSEKPIGAALKPVVSARIRLLPPRIRTVIVKELAKAGLGQREIHQWTGVHRDTIRSVQKDEV